MGLDGMGQWALMWILPIMLLRREKRISKWNKFTHKDSNYYGLKIQRMCSQASSCSTRVLPPASHSVTLCRLRTGKRGRKVSYLLFYKLSKNFNRIHRKSVPSFDTLILDGSSSQMPFANSLTLTHDDFSNFLHKDNDEIPIAYGMWWSSTAKSRRGPFSLDDSGLNHKDIHGGSFFWGEYNVGVNFEKYVELNFFYCIKLLIGLILEQELPWWRFSGGVRWITIAHCKVRVKEIRQDGVHLYRLPKGVFWP
jgi:hypothetical protein